MSFYCVTNVNDCLAEMFFKKLLIKAEIWHISAKSKLKQIFFANFTEKDLQ